MVSLILALAAAAAAAYGYSSVAGVVKVAVASSDIRADELASDKNVGAGQVPRGALQGDTVRDLSEINGMVAKGFIPQGTVLRKSMFQSVQSAGVAARLLAMPGRVALAVQSSIDTTVGGSVKAGSEVAVYSLTKNGPVRLVERAPVLSAPEKGAQGGAVLLALTPQEAELILRAQGNREQLSFYLHPPGGEAR